MLTPTTATDGRTVGPERAPAELLDVKAVAALLRCSVRPRAHLDQVNISVYI